MRGYSINLILRSQLFSRVYILRRCNALGLKKMMWVLWAMDNKFQIFIFTCLILIFINISSSYLSLSFPCRPYVVLCFKFLQCPVISCASVPCRRLSNRILWNVYRAMACHSPRIHRARVICWWPSTYSSPRNWQQLKRNYSGICYDELCGGNPAVWLKLMVELENATRNPLPSPPKWNFRPAKPSLCLFFLFYFKQLIHKMFK